MTLTQTRYKFQTGKGPFTFTNHVKGPFQEFPLRRVKWRYRLEFHTSFILPTSRSSVEPGILSSCIESLTSDLLTFVGPSDVKHLGSVMWYYMGMNGKDEDLKTILLNCLEIDTI